MCMGVCVWVCVGVCVRECIGVCLSNNYAHRAGSPIVVPFLSAICVLFLFYFILFTNNFRLFFIFCFFFSSIRFFVLRALPLFLFIYSGI